ncbi:MAG: response regulator [Longimicrobiales bacterium]|jgi:DNA-binding response OmpR family regulator
MDTILIVEDNPELLALLRELLSSEYEIATARRGEDAIELAKRKRPRVVILDLQLPTIDGIETGRWIKKELGPDRVAILVLTALAGKGDSEAILDSGCCDAYMAKPAHIDDIRGKVKELLELTRTS